MDGEWCPLDVCCKGELLHSILGELECVLGGCSSDVVQEDGCSIGGCSSSRDSNGGGYSRGGMSIDLLELWDCIRITKRA